MRQLGSIHCLESTFSHAPEDMYTILFHGFGADAYDLQPLADVFQAKSQFLFPQGPLTVPIGPGWTGRAWWKLDMARWQEAQATGNLHDLTEWVPDELPALRKNVFKMIDALKVPWKNILLGGFSQGAMLAADIFTQAPETPRGLIAMSGALINHSELKEKIANRKGAKFFISHGDRDPVVSVKGSQRLETFLTQNGLQGRLHTFSGGHEIPPGIVQKVNEYLKTI